MASYVQVVDFLKLPFSMLGENHFASIFGADDQDLKFIC